MAEAELSTLQEILAGIRGVGKGIKVISKPIVTTAKLTKKATDIATLGTTGVAAKAAAKLTRQTGRATINAITGLGNSIKGSFIGAIPGLPSPKDFIGILKKGAFALLIPAIIAFVKSPFFEKIKATLMDTVVPAIKNFYTNTIEPLIPVIKDGLIATFEFIKTTFFDVVVPAIKNFYTNVIQPLLPVIKDGFIASWQFIKEKFFDVVVPALKNLYENILLPVKDILIDMFFKQWELLKVAFQDLADGVKKIFDGDVIGGIMDIFKGIGKYILKTLDNLGTTVYNIIASIFGLEETDSVYGSIKKFITDVYTSIKNFFVNTYNSVKNFFVDTYEQVKKFVSDNFDNIKSVFMENFNKVKEFVSNLAIFKFFEETFGGLKDSIIGIFTAPTKEELIKNIFGVGKGLIDIIYYPINVAVNAIKDIFKIGDPDTPFKLSDFIFESVEKIINYFKELLDFDFNAIIKKIPGAEKVLSFIGFGEKSADEINDEIAALQARIDRSLAGVDEFTFGEESGRKKTAEKIAILQEQLEEQSRARGGPIESGQPYFVGEQGVELVVPTANAQVFSAQRTQELLERALSGGGGGRQAQPVVVNAPTTSVSRSDNITSGSHAMVNTDPFLQRLSSYSI